MLAFLLCLRLEGCPFNAHVKEHVEYMGLSSKRLLWSCLPTHTPLANPLSQANAEKQRLEHKQRAARKAAERGDPIRPRWFDFVQDAKAGEEPSYRYPHGTD